MYRLRSMATKGYGSYDQGLCLTSQGLPEVQDPMTRFCFGARGLVSGAWENGKALRFQKNFAEHV